MSDLNILRQVKWKAIQSGLKLYLQTVAAGDKSFLVYYHLPRTAGTAIKHAVREQGLASRILTLPHDANVRNVTFRYQNLIRFASIRHPLSWYASMYNIKCQTVLSGRLQTIKDYARMPANSFDDFFQDLVLYRQGQAGLKKWNKPWQPSHIAYETSRRYFPQYGFLTNLFIYLFFTDIPAAAVALTASTASTLLGVDHLLRLESIQADLDELLHPLGLTLSLRKKAKTAPRSSPTATDYFTAEQIKLVKERDRLIFDLYYPAEV